MNPAVLKRFIVIVAVVTVAMFTLWTVVLPLIEEPPGDYETRQGDILLGEGKLDEAYAKFTEALRLSPDHRGAMMGRALVHIKAENYPDAVHELTALIDFLNGHLVSDDATGRAVLASAYANRGIVHDRQGRYEQALADYIEALKTDDETLTGPSLFDKILYGTPRPSTVRDRARYLYEQLKLPPEERLMRVPEIDAKQRMYKP